jgi:hypothetical protein
MRTMRPATWPTVALAAFIALTPRLHAQQVEQGDPYTPTLHFGTGLINIPVAWAAPRNGALFVGTSGKEIPSAANESEMKFASRWNTNIAFQTDWLGRFSVGVAAYSQNIDWGAFGQALLVRDGTLGFLPGVAVGVRNLGPDDHQERFLIGHDIALEGNEYGEVVPSYFEDFSTAPTFYAVATKDFVVARRAGFPSVSFGLTGGWGNGIFSDDGGLGDQYNAKGTIAEGLFLGGRLVTHPTTETTLSFLAENDGWDWNAGVSADWRGITVGFFGTELEEGSERDPNAFLIYNYRKWNVSLSYSGNIFDISRGVLLRTRISDLAREQVRLRTEIAQRERRIQGLQVALRQAQAGELANLQRRREELERAVQEERDAIRRAEERLRQIQEGQTPTPQPQPAPPPSSSNAPSLH